MLSLSGRLDFIQRVCRLPDLNSVAISKSSSQLRRLGFQDGFVFIPIGLAHEINLGLCPNVAIFQRNRFIRPESEQNCSPRVFPSLKCKEVKAILGLLHVTESEGGLQSEKLSDQGR